MAFNKMTFWLVIIASSVIFEVTIANTESEAVSRKVFLEMFKADMIEFGELEKQAEISWDSLKADSVLFDTVLDKREFWLTIDQKIEHMNSDMIDLMINRIEDLKAEDLKNRFFINLLVLMLKDNRIGRRSESEVDDIMKQLKKKYADRMKAEMPEWRARR